MKFIRSTVLALVFMLSACSSMPPIKTVDHVDLKRFMGDWYVIANIPTFIETQAYNAIETYALAEDGSIATTFTFNKGGFDGPLKTYRPRGFVSPHSNAIWGMRFIWPFKADYRIIYLNDDYSITLIGRNKRDYLWLMARTPSLPDNRQQAVLEIAASLGYDISKVRTVPQQERSTIEP